MDTRFEGERGAGQLARGGVRLDTDGDAFLPTLGYGQSSVGTSLA